MPREKGGQLAFELHFGDCKMGTASFAPTPGSSQGLFSCSVGPLSDETIMALERAANAHTPIRLMFSDPLVLDLVTLERKEPHSVRIVGHVVRTKTTA